MAFFRRLIGLRTDFAFTMSDDERAPMGRHAAYLRSPGSKAVAFGRVDGPAGPWDLGVFEATDEAELNGLVAQDPTVLSGAGFRYDILPMLAGGRGAAPAQAT